VLGLCELRLIEQDAHAAQPKPDALLQRAERKTEMLGSGAM
jgi:hypothetical protein